MGSPADDVPPLRLLNSKNVGHFDREGMTLSRMRRFNKVVRVLASEKGVWKTPNASHYWNGRTITTMWDAIWDDLRPYFLTETQLTNGRQSYHKSRVNSLSHDKLKKKGVFDRLQV